MFITTLWLKPQGWGTPALILHRGSENLSCSSGIQLLRHSVSEAFSDEFRSPGVHAAAADPCVDDRFASVSGARAAAADAGADQFVRRELSHVLCAALRAALVRSVE